MTKLYMSRNDPHEDSEVDWGEYRWRYSLLYTMNINDLHGDHPVAGADLRYISEWDNRIFRYDPADVRIISPAVDPHAL